MSRKIIKPSDIDTNIFDFYNNWLLLASGDFKTQQFNSMTISWGFAGIVWGEPCVQIMVRPNRFTYEFIEKNKHFTINAFDADMKETLAVFGSKSGRDIDKINYPTLTPIASNVIASPTYEQANISLECEVLHSYDILPTGFETDEINKWYENDPYHRVYVAKIVAVTQK